MRVRPLVLILFWGTAFIWVGYNGMQAVSSYFQTNDVAEQAFRDASERQRQRNPGELFSSDFIADLRAGVLTGAGPGLADRRGSARLSGNRSPLIESGRAAGARPRDHARGRNVAQGQIGEGTARLE